MPQLHIPDILLVNLKPIPPKHHTQRQIKFRPRQVDAETTACPPTKGHHEAVERDAVGRGGVVEPALGQEGVGGGEDGFVVGEFGDRH